ncbi:glycosyltransferase family 2 protein [Edaphobacter aggregans]|uniref:glycosyltransferase family 2 protein n=1 Tax=Edaphobacter aggregans TaxID=570835 RepID=UPI000554BE2D|nr:glycosyltransferase family A protein [Edaphobacter aggregans]
MANEHSSVTISVVIPAYNAGSLIGETLDSVLAQSCPAHEIIVVDDGSTDDTAEVVRRYGNAVRYLRQENQGQAIARNTGIHAATGEWIAPLDSDDISAGSSSPRDGGDRGEPAPGRRLLGLRLFERGRHTHLLSCVSGA